MTRATIGVTRVNAQSNALRYALLATPLVFVAIFLLGPLMVTLAWSVWERDLLGPWYGAQITLTRGYMTNPDSVAYAAAQGDDFSADEAKKIADIDANVKSKFELGGTWQNRWPTHIRQYESEWARFKAS